MADDLDYEDEGDITDLCAAASYSSSHCSQFLDGVVIVCGAFGSEWCDFECPLRRDVGLTPKEAEYRAIQEIHAEIRAEREAKGAAEYDSWFNTTSTRTDGANG